MSKRNGMIEHADGDRVWYRNGKLHREDGPATVHGTATASGIVRTGRLSRAQTASVSGGAMACR